MANRFQVRHEQTKLIVPAEPTPREIKQLSDIDDQRGTRCHYPMIMFYKNSPLMEGKDPVRVIREALAKTLVHYYPFAGRFIEGPNDKFLVNCNSEGVMFVEAVADVKLEQLGDTILPPCLFSRELLCEVFGSRQMVGCPLMLIQVTRFICGGFALGVRVNHVMSDASGLVQFLNAVAEIARGASTPSLKPVWRRELLTARSPPRITCIHHEYENNNDDNNRINGRLMDQTNPSHRSFFFGPKEISAIWKHLQPQHRNSSKFDVITACVWRSRTLALQLHPDEDVRITCMTNVSGKNYLNLPDGYYGNAIVSPAAVCKAKILCENPLGYAVELLKKAKAQVKEEYIRSVIDFMATKGRPPFSTSWNFTVSDVSRAGFDEIDIGWGKPIYGGTMDGGTSTGVSIYDASLYTRFKNNKGENGILVPMCLPKPLMERFEKELRKLTQESVDDLNKLKTTKISSML